jgi:4-hydroxybenzoate polyprenyltransferase
VYGWYGTTGELAPVFALLVPVAVVTGAALSIANTRADTERDTAAGIDSVAIRLGPDRSWLVASGLLVAVATIAVVTLVAWRAPLAAVLGAGAGIVVIGIGIGAGRDPRPARLERAWELQAVGVGVLAAAWLAGWAAT